MCKSMCAYVRVRACVRACARACRMCVRALVVAWPTSPRARADLGPRRCWHAEEGRGGEGHLVQAIALNGERLKRCVAAHSSRQRRCNQDIEVERIQQQRTQRSPFSEALKAVYLDRSHAQACGHSTEHKQ